MYSLAEREVVLGLLAEGRSLNSLSKQVGISRAAIREWRDHGLQPKQPHATCFACRGRRPDAAADYCALLGYYLGDGCLSRMRRTLALRVSCDQSYPGVIADVTALKAPGVIVVQNCWNHWPCLFPQHGRGRKHERPLVLEAWQRQLVEQHPADFLRGLFHSDGCRVRNWATRTVAGARKRYDYPRWQFSNNSADIMGWCQAALDLVEVPWRQSSWKVLSVSTRTGVARLDELIGPKT